MTLQATTEDLASILLWRATVALAKKCFERLLHGVSSMCLVARGGKPLAGGRRQDNRHTIRRLPRIQADLSVKEGVVSSNLRAHAVVFDAGAIQFGNNRAGMSRTDIHEAMPLPNVCPRGRCRGRRRRCARHERGRRRARPTTRQARGAAGVAPSDRSVSLRP